MRNVSASNASRLSKPSIIGQRKLPTPRVLVVSSAAQKMTLPILMTPSQNISHHFQILQPWNRQVQRRCVAFVTKSVAEHPSARPEASAVHGDSGAKLNMDQKRRVFLTSEARTARHERNHYRPTSNFQTVLHKAQTLAIKANTCAQTRGRTSRITGTSCRGSSFQKPHPMFEMRFLAT